MKNCITSLADFKGDQEYLQMLEMLHFSNRVDETEFQVSTLDIQVPFSETKYCADANGLAFDIVPDSDVQYVNSYYSNIAEESSHLPDRVDERVLHEKEHLILNDRAKTHPTDLVDNLIVSNKAGLLPLNSFTAPSDENVTSSSNDLAEECRSLKHVNHIVSLVQLLVSLPELSEKFELLRESETFMINCSETCRSFLNLYEALKNMTKNQDVVKDQQFGSVGLLQKFHRLSGKLTKELANLHKGQDSHELWIALSEHLDKEVYKYNESGKGETLISHNKLFQLVIERKIKCTQCNRTKPLTDEEWQGMTVYLGEDYFNSGNSIQQLIFENFKKEELDHQCNETESHVRGKLYLRAKMHSTYVSLFVSRFRKSDGGVLFKISSYVEIKMGIFVDGGFGLKDPQWMQKTCHPSRPYYQLVAVLSHHGKVRDEGTFSTTTFDEDANTWINWTGNVAREVSQKQVLQDASHSGYLMIYKKLDKNPLSGESV